MIEPDTSRQHGSRQQERTQEQILEQELRDGEEQRGQEQHSLDSPDASVSESSSPDSSQADSPIDDLYASLEQPRPLLIVISGPSGVGKDATLHLMKQRKASFYFVVTATTREKRENETDGVDYHFVSMGEFAEMIEQGELLEYAVVYGDYKGIPKKHVREALASGMDVIMRIDVQGAATIRNLLPEAVTIFLTAESEEELVRRLRERKTEQAGKLKMRIATARQELKRIVEFDYVVVNREDRLQDTVDQVFAIITAEKLRVDWKPVQI